MEKILLTTADGQTVIGMCLTKCKLLAIATYLSVHTKYEIKSMWTDGADLTVDGFDCFIRFEKASNIEFF
jgi:hypothetical protein